MSGGAKVALAVLGLFGLCACAWIALFIAAGRADVRRVPLATTSVATPAASASEGR